MTAAVGVRLAGDAARRAPARVREALAWARERADRAWEWCGPRVETAWEWLQRQRQSHPELCYAAAAVLAACVVWRLARRYRRRRRLKHDGGRGLTLLLNGVSQNGARRFAEFIGMLEGDAATWFGTFLRMLSPEQILKLADWFNRAGMSKVGELAAVVNRLASAAGKSPAAPGPVPGSPADPVSAAEIIGIIDPDAVNDGDS